MISVRNHDIVLLGATGFTGTLTAYHLATASPPSSSLAIAGRSGAKLEALRAQLLRIRGGTDVRVLVADVLDPGAIGELARSTRVLVNAVGPYTTLGDGVVAACAEAGTDYLDLAAEERFVESCRRRHHDRAIEAGARILHGCGFQAIPFDLATLHAVERLRGPGPRRATAYVELHFGGLGKAARGFSSGSLRSALSMFAETGRDAEPASGGGAAWGRRGGASGRLPHRTRDPPGWALPAPGFSARTVCRSATALACYGEDFSYDQFVLVPRLRTALAIAGALAGFAAVARVPALRRRALDRLPDGAGPSEAERRRRSFAVNVIATAGAERAVTRVTGGDFGYEESAKMLGEAALCLAFDALPEAAGETTPAIAMGGALIARLVRSGIGFAAEPA